MTMAIAGTRVQLDLEQMSARGSGKPKLQKGNTHAKQKHCQPCI